MPAPLRSLLLALRAAAWPVQTAMPADEPAPLERVGTIALEGPVGGLDHMAIDTRRRHLLVANTSNNSLDIVDLEAGKLLVQVPGQGGIRGVDYAADLDHILVGNGAGGLCNVLDAKDHRLLRSVPLGVKADNVRYHPRAGRIYVVHADRELSVIDARSYAVGDPIPLLESLGAFKVETSRPRMYVNAKAAGLVLAIDADTSRVVGRFPVAPAGTNASLALDEAGRRLFVGCRTPPTLLAMDADTGRIVATAPIAGGVDDLWFDPARGRLYASCGAGTGAIAVVRRGGDHLEPLAEIPTASGARTSGFDAASGRLYVAVPRRADRPEQIRPELWVYQARP